MLRRKRFAVGLGAAAALTLTGSLTAHAVLAPTPEGFTHDRSSALAAALDPTTPRNVILVIGDGMDDSIITAARNYEHGAGGRFAALDALPFTGAMTTYGLKAGAGPDHPIAYVSDSAPTASGWSTGRKTIDGRLSQGPSAAATTPGEDYETVLEKFKKAGKLVGNVSTAEITDATPAAAAAHINARACQGPRDMATCASAKKPAGGKGSVAEQLVDSGTDVMLGGGLNRFTQATDAGPTVQAYATAKGYRGVGDKAGLEAITSLEDGPVLGLFSGGNMTPRYQPLVATPPPGAGSPSTTCQVADRGNQPSFVDMTAKAIELLDRGDTANKGFFLQAESAMIDKQEHASDICGAIGDVVALDESVAAALAFQKKEPDTLIVVTGDHAHSTQIVGGTGEGRQTATVRTADGDPMTVAYSTNSTGSHHTGTQIRVAAAGPQAANVTGVIDQTDLFATLLGRTPSTLPTVPGPVRPATPAAPSASLTPAGPVSVHGLRKKGLPVAVAASGATRVTLVARQGSRTVATRTVPAAGGVVRIKGRATRGTLRLTVTAVGTGGRATASAKARITRR